MNTSTLKTQYPAIVKFFEENSKDEITNWDAAICEALDAIEDKGSYELGSMHTKSGIPKILSSVE